jgi:ATP-dependent Lon protease
LLAAKRGGIKTVFIPKENEKDLDEVPVSIVKALEIIPVEKVDEILVKAYIGGSPFVDTDVAQSAEQTVEPEAVSPAKKSPAKKSPAKKSPAKKSTAKKSTAKKSTAK